VDVSFGLIDLVVKSFPLIAFYSKTHKIRIRNTKGCHEQRSIQTLI
jgi:hypothetical protein